MYESCNKTDSCIQIPSLQYHYGICTYYSAAVESTGQAKAEAQSRAEAAKIEGEAAVEQAKLKAEASKIEAVSSNHVNSYKGVNSTLIGVH